MSNIDRLVGTKQLLFDLLTCISNSLTFLAHFGSF